MSSSLVNPVNDPLKFAGGVAGDLFGFFSRLFSGNEPEVHKRGDQLAQEAFAEAVASAQKQQEDTAKELAKLKEDIAKAKNGEDY